MWDKAFLVGQSSKAKSHKIRNPQNEQEGNSLSDRPLRAIFCQVVWIGYLIISQSIAYFDAAGKNNYGGMTQVVLDIWGWIYWSLGQYIKGRSQVYYVCPDRGS